jgi:hypothetical protein
LIDLVPSLTRKWLRGLSLQGQGKHVGGYLDVREGRAAATTSARVTQAAAAAAAAVAVAAAAAAAAADGF